MFEELLDSAASAAAAEPSQSQGATPSKSRFGSKSESSRTAAATGKAYRALKDLVGAARPQSCSTQPDPFHQQTPERLRRSLSLALSRAQVEEQCNDPKLMQCGLEKVVASDGSVEWVAAHSKVSL